MAISNVLASVAVRNLIVSTKWYEQLFGRPPDAQPMAEVAQWRFDGGGEIQVYQLAERAGRGSATFVVTNIDDHRARLERLSTSAPETIENRQVRVIMVKDPDGNSLAFSQPMEK